jgi:tetratricopeptide (TPR) repeat protein
MKTAALTADPTTENRTTADPTTADRATAAPITVDPTVGGLGDPPRVPIFNQREPLREAVSDLTDEAIKLYASGQFARACDRFGQAFDDVPASAARRGDVARCYEAWGWQTLRQGRAAEAMLLFSQGLHAAPEAPSLLKGLGVAAVHAGRVDEALGPLERALALEFDARASVLLAHLYDHRDDPTRAVAHLRAVLAREPTHDAARRMIDKVERERQAEAGFHRTVTPHFLVKSRSTTDAEAPRAMLAALEAAWERVSAELGEGPRDRVTVVLYERQQFQDVTRVHAWVTGLFDGKIRLPVGGPTPSRRELERLLAHEVAHATIHRLSHGHAPRWLHEGLAQVLEGTAADPMLRLPGAPTLAGVEALVSDADPLRARTGYDVSLWIVRDLLDRGGMPAMRELLRRLGRGEPLETAIPPIYGLRQADLETQWRRVLGG